jgi:hypothetical protein
MSRLRMPGQGEIHLKTEKAPRRRQLLDAAGGGDVQVSIYSAEHVKIGQEQARSARLHPLVVDLADHARDACPGLSTRLRSPGRADYLGGSGNAARYPYCASIMLTRRPNP